MEIKKKTNGKNKGSAFERTIANLFTEQLNPLCFSRVISSGAFLGGKNSHRADNFTDGIATSLIGDIYCSNNEEFKYTIECKNYKDTVSFHRLLECNCIIYTWYNECKEDCKKNGKDPLLIFKFNRIDPHFCVDVTDIIGIGIPSIVINNKRIGLLEDLLKAKPEYFLKRKR